MTTIAHYLSLLHCIVRTKWWATIFYLLPMAPNIKTRKYRYFTKPMFSFYNTFYFSFRTCISTLFRKCIVFIVSIYRTAIHSVMFYAIHVEVKVITRSYTFEHCSLRYSCFKTCLNTRTSLYCFNVIQLMNAIWRNALLKQHYVINKTHVQGPCCGYGNIHCTFNIPKFDSRVLNYASFKTKCQIIIVFIYDIRIQDYILSEHVMF